MSDHWHLAQQASGSGSMQSDDSCVCCNCAEAPAAAGGAQLIDGKMTSELIRKEIALEAAAVKSQYGKASPPTHSGHSHLAAHALRQSYTGIKPSVLLGC